MNYLKKQLHEKYNVQLGFKVSFSTQQNFSLYEKSDTFPTSCTNILRFLFATRTSASEPIFSIGVIIRFIRCPRRPLSRRLDRLSKDNRRHDPPRVATGSGLMNEWVDRSVFRSLRNPERFVPEVKWQRGLKSVSSRCTSIVRYSYSLCRKVKTSLLDKHQWYFRLCSASIKTEYTFS